MSDEEEKPSEQKPEEKLAVMILEGGLTVIGTIVLAPMKDGWTLIKDVWRLDHMMEPTRNGVMRRPVLLPLVCIGPVTLRCKVAAYTFVEQLEPNEKEVTMKLVNEMNRQAFTQRSGIALPG